LACIMLSLFFSSPASPPPVNSSLSLHDALPIYHEVQVGGAHRGTAHRVQQPPDRPVVRNRVRRRRQAPEPETAFVVREQVTTPGDRKSTRLNSSHVKNSYAVFCSKKNKKREVRQ